MHPASDRVHRLLAERVRMGTTPRRCLYATLAALIASGAWWVVAHYGPLFAASSDDMVRLSHEALALKLHGAAAFVSLFALGAVSAQHARRGWALRRNRRLGSAVLAVFALLVVTGYALYYLVSEESRPSVSLLHWVVGALLAPLLVWHIASGRKSRATAQRFNHHGATATPRSSLRR
jgi:hypothetical protein